jgi:hypothetical protein
LGPSGAAGLIHGAATSGYVDDASEQGFRSGKESMTMRKGIIRVLLLSIAVLASSFVDSRKAQAFFCRDCQPIGGGHYLCPVVDYPGGNNCQIKYDPILGTFLCHRVRAIGPCQPLFKMGLQAY